MILIGEGFWIIKNELIPEYIEISEENPKRKIEETSTIQSIGGIETIPPTSRIFKRLK